MLAGSRIAGLEGIDPGELVAYRYVGGHKRRHKSRRWKRIPVQVDERAVVDFGVVPGSNAPTGTPGTVYGTAPAGVTTLQYTDSNTWVGPDPDSTLDENDEVALMASDAGKRAPRKARRPRGTRGKGASRIRLVDAITGGNASVYLFAAKHDGASLPDYVSYDFHLGSGDYKSTYRRAAGPNPEASRVATRDYQAGFSDRWIYDQLAISAGGASDADILDGYKFAFAPGVCGRSERTFSDAEGAFVVNKDGPVRAIRSYVGANSGPYTQRTDYFYRDEHVIQTDLRVHPITGLFTQTDLSSNAIGMTYRNSANPAGVPVDGHPDGVSNALAEWHQWSGDQGTLFSADRTETTITAVAAQAHGWYLDDSTPAQTQCWGDAQALGQAGLQTTASLPSTDPRVAPYDGDTLTDTTTEQFGPPGAGAADADAASRRLDASLSVNVSRR